MTSIKNVDQLNAKRKTHLVKKYRFGWVVSSGASGNAYRVTLGDTPTCTCPWGKYRKEGQASACSHVQAVIAHLAAEDGYTSKARLEANSTKHLHRREVTVGDGVKMTLRRD